MSLQTPPALFFVSVLVCAIPAGALAAETPPQPKPSASAETGSKDKPALIIHNPDGTMTVQKQAPAGKSEGTKQKGLVIPPQVVVPTARVPEKDPSNPAR